MNKDKKQKKVCLDSNDRLYKSAKSIPIFAVILEFFLGYVTYSPTTIWYSTILGYFFVQLVLCYLMKNSISRGRIDICYLIFDIAMIEFAISSYAGFNIISILYFNKSVYISIMITMIVFICALILTFAIKGKMLRKHTTQTADIKNKKIYTIMWILGIGAGTIAAFAIPREYNDMALSAYLGMLFLFFGFVLQYCVVTVFMKYKEAKRRMNKVKY